MTTTLHAWLPVHAPPTCRSLLLLSIAMSMAILMALVQLHFGVLCCSGCSHSSYLTISGRPAIVHKKHVHGASLEGLSMTRPPENAHYLRARAFPAVLCASTGLFPRLAWCIHQPSNSTRLIPSTIGPVLSFQPCPTGAGRRPAVAPPSDDHLVLVLGWSHTSNGSLNYYILLGTPQPVSDPSVLGRLRKGTPANPGTSSILSTTQQPSRAPGLSIL